MAEFKVSSINEIIIETFFLKIVTSYHGKSVIFSTSYRPTENEFGHTDILHCDIVIYYV